MDKNIAKGSEGGVMPPKMPKKRISGGMPTTPSQVLSESEQAACNQKLKEILAKANEYEAFVAQQNFTPEEEGEFYKQKFSELGLQYVPETGKILTITGGDLGLDPSQFGKNLGGLPVSQMAHIKNYTYHFENYIGQRLVENGAHLAFYRDYFDADDLPAYEIPEGAQYVDKLYNPPGSQQFEENGRVYVNLHKGFKMPSTALNDFTSKPSIFLALLSDVAENVARPMAKAFYIYRMQMLQDPEDVDTQKKDGKTITNDLEITYKTLDDLLFQMRTFEQKLATTSRDTAPEAGGPNGANQGLEFNIDPQEYRGIADNRPVNAINIFVKSGRYHEDFLDILSKIDSYSFDETFGKYLGSTNYGEQFESTGECYFRYAPLAGEMRNEIIYMYQGIRSQPLLVFGDVIHSYVRYGRFFNKLYPIYKVHAKTADGKFPPVPNYPGSGNGSTITPDDVNQLIETNPVVTGNKKAIGDISKIDAGGQNDIVSSINFTFDKAQNNQNNIGNMVNLKTDANGDIVSAVNEVNEKTATNASGITTAKADIATNKTAIGTLSSLATTEKSNLVGAVNEVNTKATTPASKK